VSSPHAASPVPQWQITDIEIADAEPDALARLFKFDERFFRLRRRKS
jgi:hypothetical protein